MFNGSFQRFIARAFVFFALLALAALSACAPGNSSSASTQATPTFVPTSVTPPKQTYKVTRGDIVSKLEFSGRVVPVTEQQAFFKADGRVRKVYAKSGDSVTKGQVLADLTSLDDLQKAQSQQAIDQKRAQINLQIAQLHQKIAATQTPLWTQNREDEMALQDLQVQLAQLDYDQQQLNGQTVQGNIQDAQLIAPVDGQILTFQVNEGDAVKAFEPVAVVADLQHLEIGAQLPDTQLSLLTEGKACTATFTVKEGAPVNCTIRSLPYPYGSANQPKANSTDNPAIALDNSNTRINVAQGTPLTIGDMVTVDIVLQEKKGVLLLPVSALRSFEGRNFVVVQTPKSNIRVDVKTGLQNQDMVEIVSGLNEGDVVVAP